MLNHHFVDMFFIYANLFICQFLNRIIYINIYSYSTMSEIESAKTFKSGIMDIMNPQSQAIKQLSPKRWKTHMIQALQKMFGQNPTNRNIIKDLITIVSSIPQSNFVQAALEIRPFKPQFIQESVFKGEVSQSTTASSITNNAKYKGQTLKVFEKKQKHHKITEKTLKNQLQRQYHPFRFIIKNFCRLLQLKYKQLIDVKKIKIQQVQKRIKSDIDTLKQFIQSAAKPYKKLFKLQKNEDSQIAFRKLASFIQGYIVQHSKLNQTIRKIVNYACKSQYSQYLQNKIQNYATPQSFNIPQQFKIDGSYALSLNSLMQFAQSTNFQTSMKKLLQFRSNILKDVDQYYTQKNGQSKDLQLNVQSLIQIIRFIIAKLKNWACQVYSQLKYLEIIYGDQQIAYKYQQASFIYTQFSVVFQILEVE